MKFAEISNDGKITGILELQDPIKIPGYVSVSDEARVGFLYDAETKECRPDPTDAIKMQIATIDQQILAIEATQPRQIREITLGLDDGSAQATLVKTNEMIGLLRKDRAALIANRR